MNKEFEKYIPEDKEIKENKEYFNNKKTLTGGSKQKKEKQIDKLMSKKFIKKYLNKNK